MFIYFIIFLFTIFSNVFSLSGVDNICQPEPVFRTKEFTKSFYNVPSFYNGAVTCSGNIFVNIGQNPGAPLWTYVASVNGLSTQVYNKTLGTLVGDFYLNISGVLTHVVKWTFTAETDNKLSSHNTFCLRNEPAGIAGYVRGDIVSNNMFYDTYNFNKEFVNANGNNGDIGAMDLGDTYFMEFFWFFNKEKSINCNMQFSNTSAFATTQMCFYFEKVSDRKRDEMLSTVIATKIDEPYTQHGKFHIPQSLIPETKRRYFKFHKD